MWRVSLFWGALLCWAGLHARHAEMRMRGLGDRCRRCGGWLPRAAGVDVR